MKRITLLVVSYMLTLGASAQGVSFGHFKQKEKIKTLLAKKTQEGQRMATVTRATIIPVEEYAEIEEDRRYRYVYAYNSNKERSSETIYMRERENGVWGEEVLYTVGTYTYEYDTQGRVKTKSVTYDNTDGSFISYRIMVTYGNDGSATYTKYEHNTYDETYVEVAKWTYRADGTLASYTCENEWGDSVTYTYDVQGNVTSYDEYSLSGGLNDVTLTYTDETESSNSYTNHYTYDDKTGKLLDFWQTGGYIDTERYTFEYDAFGRISSIKGYDLNDSDSEVVEDGVLETRTTALSNAANWLLAYEENYTYFSDEVYGITNPWKVAFGIDGPLTQMSWTEYESGASYGEDLNGDGVVDDNDRRSYGTETTYFQRDANGMLTAIRYSDTETESGAEYTVTVNANGEIVSMKDEYENIWTDNGVTCRDYSLDETTYTWENGKIVKEVTKTEYSWWSPDGDYSGNSTSEVSYAYTDNSVTKTDESGSVIEIMQDGPRYMVRKWSGDEFEWESDDYIIRDIQTEDVSFIRPNLKKDREGFTVDVPVVLSRAGRVVCVGYESMGSGDDCINSEMDGNWHYLNIEAEEDEYSSKDELMGIYYSISHDGDLTIASNVEGLPVYVLKGSRLMKEYKYYDIEYSVGGSMGSTEVTRAITIPAGQAYDEISYLYNDGGLLVGKQLVSVDEEGERTGEITLDYKYDANGVVHTEMVAKGHVCLNDRILELSDGGTFDVYMTNGQTVATNVTFYNFDQAGIYIIVANNESVKLTVK